MRILVVEDELRIINSIKKGLEQERYAIDVTYIGADGSVIAQNAQLNPIQRMGGGVHPDSGTQNGARN